jgi:hypothetical protein
MDELLSLRNRSDSQENTNKRLRSWSGTSFSFFCPDALEEFGVRQGHPIGGVRHK